MYSLTSAGGGLPQSEVESQLVRGELLLDLLQEFDVRMSLIAFCRAAQSMFFSPHICLE